MTISTMTVSGKAIAVVTECNIIRTTADALDLLASVRYETHVNCLAIDKRLLDEKFFILSSGFAGEVLQKFVNYQMKLAIWGDYSRYTSKPLQDFIRESNQGRAVGFLATQEDAVAWLASR